MDQAEALSLMQEYVKNPGLRRHMLAVAAAMQDYADRFGEDREAWSLAGLLHDFDWEIHPTLERHPQDGAPILRERGVPEQIVECILSHANHTGIPRTTRMQRALFACDEITGLISATALVRPSRSVLEVGVPSIRKKWKDGRFAANVRRDDIVAGADELGVELWEHIGNVLSSMQRIAPDLGLDGSG